MGAAGLSLLGLPHSTVACSNGPDADAPATSDSGAPGAKPGLSGSLRSLPDDSDTGPCEGETWKSPSDDRAIGSCGPIVDGLIVCVCGDQTYLDVPADRCDQALLEYCGVDIEDPGNCGSSLRGRCWPTDHDDTYQCRCQNSDEIVERFATNCDDALSSSCMEDCEGPQGACAMTSADTFDCECTREPGAGAPIPLPADGGSPSDGGQMLMDPPPPSFDSCEEALIVQCGSP